MHTSTQHTLETLARILARLCPSTFVREALAMVTVGDMPPADLLARCGIRAGTVLL